MEYEILEKLMYGIRQPHLCLKVIVDSYVKKIEIHIDEKIKTMNTSKDENEILIDMDLPTNVKKIEVYVVRKSNSVLIYKKRYDYVVRLFKILSKPFRMLWDRIYSLIRPINKAIKIAWTRHHFLIPPHRIKRYIKSLKQNYKHPMPTNLLNPESSRDYNIWLNQHNTKIIDLDFKYKPLISVVIPVYNADAKDLDMCIKSVLNQTYSNFEICISDDNSTKQETIEVLKKYSNNDKIKINFRKDNGMISKNMNSAIEMSSGEFIGFLDNDDLLDKNALYYVVKELNNNKKLDLIYTDEDKISENGKFCEPNFKPDWSPDTLLSMNYICHFTLIRKKC